MIITFLFLCPVKKLESESRVSLDFKYLSYEIGRNSTEFVEFSCNRWAPLVTAFTEGIDDETGDGGETEGGGEGEGGGRILWSGVWVGEEVWVPFLDLEWVGGFRGLWFGWGEGLAIGEETAVDGWAVLGRLTVTVEEIELVGFRWCLRRHFQSTKLNTIFFLCNLFQLAL